MFERTQRRARRVLLTTETEFGVTLNHSSGTTSGSGVVQDTVGETVSFKSLDALDITGNISASSGGSFGNLDITVPGHSFDDLAFGLKMTGTGSTDTDNLTVSWNGGSFTYNDLKGAADLSFFLVASSPITFVDLTSTTGIVQAKQFSISSIAAIPELSTWAMFLIGFAGLGFAGYRTSRKAASIA